MQKEKYDFFISHASEDKDNFVRPLVEELTKRGFRLWYDEFSLELGDSIIEGISKGIKGSLFGIVILSTNFFKKQWAKKELESLIYKEVEYNEKLILPIWLNITSKDVSEFSPLLSDTIAIKTKSEDIKKTADEIEKKFKAKFPSTSDIQIRDRIKYLKTCTDDERNKYFLDLEFRIKNIHFYLREYENFIYSLPFNEEEPNENTDILIKIRAKKLQSEYEIPSGVWIEESFSSYEMEKTLKLCRKWVFRKLNYEKAFELYLLLDEILDTDVYYILYGFPHFAIKNQVEAENGIFEVGIKNQTSKKEKIKAFENAYKNIFSY